MGKRFARFDGGQLGRDEATDARLPSMATFDEYRAFGFTEAQAALLARESAGSSALTEGMLDALRAILTAVEGTNTRLDDLGERVGRIQEHLRTSPGTN